MFRSPQYVFPFFLVLMAFAATAQDAPPPTEIFIAGISSDGSIEQAVNISNHPGYDNQPAFSTNGQSIYFTRFDDGQTDIWSWHSDSEELVRVSDTPESEYSPTPVPEQQRLSMVRVEQNGAQRLWTMDPDGSSMEVLIEELDTVGYHSWYSPGSVALFLLPEPFQLKLYASASEQLDVADNIGRAFQRMPGSRALVYVDKNEKPWQLRAFDPAARESEVILQMFPGVEDFTIDGNGFAWCGNGSKVYRADLNADQPKWRLAGDLRADGVRGITRIAVSPFGRQIAVVAEE